MIYFALWTECDYKGFEVVVVFPFFVSLYFLNVFSLYFCCNLFVDRLLMDCDAMKCRESP